MSRLFSGLAGDERGPLSPPLSSRPGCRVEAGAAFRLLGVALEAVFDEDGADLLLEELELRGRRFRGARQLSAQKQGRRSASE